MSSNFAGTSITVATLVTSGLGAFNGENPHD
jgi:hypothetical protein